MRAVEVVAQGKPFFSPAIADTLLEDYMRQLQQRGLQDSYDLLTDREKEILQLLAEGKSNKDVAGILNLSINTVETHRTASCRNWICTAPPKSCSTQSARALFPGFAQREKEQNTRGTKRTQKAQKGPHTPHFCAFCALICAFCVPFPFRWAKPPLCNPIY